MGRRACITCIINARSTADALDQSLRSGSSVDEPCGASERRSGTAAAATEPRPILPNIEPRLPPPRGAMPIWAWEMRTFWAWESGGAGGNVRRYRLG